MAVPNPMTIHAKIPQFDLEAQRQQFAAGNAATEFPRQRELLGLQEGGSNFRAALAADASKYPATLQQQRFDRILPLINGQLDNGSFERVGGQSPPSPNISVGPVWGQQQIKGQVNQARASNDMRTGTQLRNIQRDTAAKGFGSNSPLQAALSQQAQQANMMANTQAGTDIPWQAAQGNADQVLKSQVARENQFASRQGEDIERRKAAQQYRSSLLSVLGGLV